MASFLRHRRPNGSVPANTADAVAPVFKTGAEAISAQQPQPEPRLTFMSLPTELHLAISQLLIYPDALSLKHTNRHFYNLTDTGTELKVEWLLERRSLHLECPNNRRCDLGSDLRFCRGSVPLLMQRRREHMECDTRPGLGCLVFGTRTCVHRKQQGRWRRYMSKKLTVELWWVLLALVPVLCFWAWMIEFIRGTRSAS